MLSEPENKTAEPTPEPFQFQDQSDREWRTWRQVCKQLEVRGIVPNDPKNIALMLAIKLWGEEQTRLTVDTCEGVKHHDRELHDSRERYAPHVIAGWDL